ncbi:hypothetical protein Harman_01780 [Haloarcula mannanilytica]|uniref:DUF7979 domain-containing protein n=1 Tax=Haloarcula mannanilytica TaxID=2509225 RepID=A0A4C2EHY7_9EURY|nr:hypothetical protein [Haloarcula mannanilytica]GCF12243.1 hypothetical protein Harman_01780 [Haloarcula mannanilytica]
MSAGTDSFIFQYLAPFIGVLLIAVGIAGAVPGGYAIIEPDLENCGNPTIGVESPDETAERFSSDEGPRLPQLTFEDLSAAEQDAFQAAIDDPVGEEQVVGDVPNADAFRRGAIVTYEGEEYYVTIVAENTCFAAAPLQFPLGVFAIALGFLCVLAPPLYRRLIRLEQRAGRTE